MMPGHEGGRAIILMLVRSILLALPLGIYAKEYQEFLSLSY